MYFSLVDENYHYKQQQLHNLPTKYDLSIIIIQVDSIRKLCDRWI